MGQVSGVRAGHLQQGSGGEPPRLPEVLAPLPARRRSIGSAACSTVRLGRARRRPALDRSAQLHRHQALHPAPEGRRPRRPACSTPWSAPPAASKASRPSVAAMEYSFIGGSMGVVVGEKITRAIERAIAGAAAGRHRVLLGRRAHDGRHPVADADGQGQRRAGPARARRRPALHLGAHRSDHRRRHRELRDAGRRQHRRAQGADRLRRARASSSRRSGRRCRRDSSAASSCSRTACSIWSSIAAR